MPEEPRDAALARVVDSHLTRLVRLAQHPDGPLRRRSPPLVTGHELLTDYATKQR
jgi:hypothetical protein